MTESTTPESLELVEADLVACLKGVEWGSPAMAAAINRYLVGLFRRGGVGLALTFTPLAEEAQAVDLPETLLRLGALQKLDQSARQALFRRAWTAANDESPPEGPGYKQVLTEILLESAFRLRRR